MLWHLMQLPQHLLIIIVSEYGKIKEGFLSIESKIVCKIADPNDSLFILLAAYYIFNISYPPGLQSFFLLLEL